MQLRIEQPLCHQVLTLLKEHHREMFEHSPPESVHALDESKFNAKDITFWSLWKDNELAGCGALKELNNEHGEIKSMRTSAGFLRQGVAKRMLEHLIDEAKLRGYRQLSLETGTMQFFAPARQLYQNKGFRQCPPFADYIEDPHSVCMTLKIQQ